MMFLREYKQDTNIPNETQKNFLLLKKQKKLELDWKTTCAIILQWA